MYLTRHSFAIANFHGIGVEIGVREGWLSQFILDNCPSVTKLYGVDINKSLIPQALLDNPRYEFIHADSYFASRRFLEEELSFVFIDGDHSYDGVLRDLIHWTPLVKKGGVVSGHDWSNGWPGVVLAVEEYCAKHNYKFHLTGFESDSQLERFKYSVDMYEDADLKKVYRRQDIVAELQNFNVPKATFHENYVPSWYFVK